jgi:hypothetical protein
MMISDVQKNYLSRSLTEGEVVKLLGSPADRYERSDSEVWLYYEIGLRPSAFDATYFVVKLRDGRYRKSEVCDH